MTRFVAVEESTNKVIYIVGRPDAPDLVGPTAETPPAQEGVVFYPWQGTLALSDAPAPDAVLEWQNEPVWVVSLASRIAHGIDQIDAAAEVARMAVIAKQTNTLEYTRAEIQARAFKAAGYPADNVPSSVSSWAEAKHRDNWTAQQAADDIIATADDWYGLLDEIRRLRLIAKEDVRHGADVDAVRARVTQFAADLASLTTG